MHVTMEESMNVAIVGFNYDFVKIFAENVAQNLGLSFVDFKQTFEQLLLDWNKSIFDEDSVLNELETEMVKKFSLLKNVVVSFPDDVILSNENYKYFKNNLIIFINSQKLNKLQLNLKKLIKNINIEINEENYNFEEIINKIRGFYDR